MIDYNELINDVFQLEQKLFRKMDAYRLIEKKCVEKCLNSDDKKQLNEEIHYVFIRLIRIIKESCPALTDEDILFCCLKQAGLNNVIIGRCMGSVSRQSFNQRKYRIKAKMKAANCPHLFDLIFQ